MNKKIILIEDDNDLLNLLMESLINHGYEVHGYTTIKSALDGLDEHEVDLILSDLSVEDNISGLDLIRTIRQRRQDLPVIVMSAFGTVETSVSCMKLGAVDFLCKPFDIKSLIRCIEDNIKVKNDVVVFDSPQMQEIKRVSEILANKDTNILLMGESGVGKEVIAQHIHKSSKRVDKPFIAINCAAIPDNMLEAILFGYEKGSYTGASSSNAGKFELADKGTILLDEISEMPLVLQAKLLRVLQENQVERIGGKKLINLDIRVIATTNRNLKEEVDAGNFREDLYYRINVFPISIPPLRERIVDIEPIAKNILGSYRADIHFENDAISILKEYSWPGNVRELDNVLQRLAVLVEGDIINAEDVKYAISGFVKQNSQINKKYSNRLKDQEAETILTELRRYNGSRSITADSLGISPRTLRYKLARFKEQGFDVPIATISGKE
ncbi:MAG: sigma-54-dependent Fis family transcriptional regulator [Francisellaceae bacterium]|jgi:two-component system, response regulator FlrC|nr:sigma-54-dependent Fis family transcriptional regulator [Francisellaceae bacterium]MBT6208023.1 sigma-54-dependent Fis family transcriptional regulator [Francisellaceae bacterium]